MIASSRYSAAGQALDLGLGSQLPQQLKDETEVERKKRQMGMSALQSPAGQALLQSPFMKG